MTPKVPATLKAHTMFPPRVDEPGEPWIIYLTDRRYRRIALVLAFCALACTVIALPFVLVGGDLAVILGFVAILVGGLGLALVGAAVQFLRGGSGFYYMDANGTIGERIGRGAPLRLFRGRTTARVTRSLSQATD